MRITAGTLKNKEVLSYKDKDKVLRPTTSKVRQAVFNLLNHGRFLPELDIINDENPSLIEGRTIADFFCGTGIVSYEAISRGAVRAIMIDISEQNIACARNNAKLLNVTEKCLFLRADVMQLPHAQYQCDVVFLDPPYNRNMLNQAIASIIKSEWVKAGGIIIAEHSKREDVTEHPQTKIIDKRKYNNSNVTILKFLGVDANGALIK
ncbi:MAG TPA: hypothetical protein DIV86_00600 [Alphaproteobacteria bacterium]|nr:hypothetical protein [Alphaproteobacteria bacterium]